MAFALTSTETRNDTCRLALFLSDAVTRDNTLQGTVNVAIAGQKIPVEKPGEATFIFFALPDGAYTITVASDADTPFYQPVAIPVTLPVAHGLWPGYPDQLLADPTLMLNDPAQTPAYRAQLDLASLKPTIAYPFVPGATLVRGIVMAGGVPLAGATVLVNGGTGPAYVTAAGGEYVLFLDKPVGMSQTITLRVQHAAKPDVLAPVTVERGRTVGLDITMAP
jgi:hypothetical protein